DQAQGLAVEAELLLAEGGDRNQAVDVVAVEDDEQAERLDAGHPAGEALADPGAEPAHLPPLEQLALGALGAPLGLGRMLGDRGQALARPLGRLGCPAAEERLQAAVDDEVRIASYRRREMEVARGGERCVAAVFRAVAGGGERAQ